MASDGGFPAALKVFFASLVAGAGGAYVGFRVAFWLAMRFIEGEYRDVFAGMLAIAGALLVGAASMVTAGVMVGKRSNG